MGFQLAIDGPSASGKSSISAKIAEILNWEHVNSGAIYRAVALDIVRKKLDYKNETIINEITSLNVNYLNGIIYLDGVDVSSEIRDDNVSEVASVISKNLKLRKIITKKLQEMVSDRNIVMDGRDIGTVILPNANLKIFLNASIDVRAKRRLAESDYKGLKDFESVKEKLIKRDESDTKREIAPLKKALDAIEFDTGGLTAEQSAHQIIKLIKNKMKEEDNNEKRNK